jgi:hypothetical protein
MDGDLEPHRKYLAERSPEWFRRQVAMFRLSDDVMDILPLVCIEDIVSGKFAKWREWVHPLDPVSLDDLKNWFGTSNEVAKRQGKVVRLSLMPDRTLPRRSFELDRIDDEQRSAVLTTARELLYNYVDPADLDKPEIRAVVDYMVERARRSGVSIFIAPELIVCPDKEIVFENIASLMFTNILIYGGGTVTVRGHTSIHSQQIRHVA